MIKTVPQTSADPDVTSGVAQFLGLVVDVAIEIARGLEKDRWFLFAHLATK